MSHSRVWYVSLLCTLATYLEWQYWQIKFKMRFVCQTGDMSII